MNLKLVPILALFGAAIGIPFAHADGKVTITAKDAAAHVEPHAARLKLINLPALEFNLHASVKCSGDAESLTLSVADTVTTLDSEALADRQSAEASLNVPARQVALAASSHFCLEDDASSADELVVPGFMTAHASLRCADEDGITAHFASAPLQIRLVCVRGTDEDQEPSEDK